jgi:hypothetical protein
MLTRDRLTKALKQIAEMARSALAQGCTTDRGIAAQEAQRAAQEADEYLAAGASGCGGVLPVDCLTAQSPQKTLRPYS